MKRDVSFKDKLLLISSRSDLSGGAKHLRDLVGILHRQFPGQIYIAAPDEEYFSYFYKRNCNKYFVIPSRSFSFISFFKLIKFCSQNGIKIIHSHGRGAGLYSRLLKLFGYKIVHTFHGIHVDKSLTGRIKFFLDYLLKGFAQRYIFVSKGERLRALRFKLLGHNKDVIIPNGIDIDEVNKRMVDIDSKEKLREKYNISENSIVVGCLGRDDYAKGIDLLLDNFEYFYKNNHLDIYLFVAGIGLDQRSFSSGNRVKFIGPQENSFEFYSLIDYYVSNSRWEGMPLTVLEAMCLKIPCLVSNVVGNNDLIQKDFSGYLFQPDNNESFSSELFKMIDSDNAEFVDNAFREVKEKYNIGLMSEKISKIYSEIIS